MRRRMCRWRNYVGWYPLLYRTVGEHISVLLPMAVVVAMATGDPSSTVPSSSPSAAIVTPASTVATPSTVTAEAVAPTAAEPASGVVVTVVRRKIADLSMWDVGYRTGI